MKLTESNLKNKQFLICGTKGTGKTFFAKQASKAFDSVIVYTPPQRLREGEWKGLDVLTVKASDFKGEFDLVIALVKKMQKKLDLFIIDEADLIFEGHWDTSKALRDLVISNRHWGLAVMFITRRPQDIPPKVYGNSQYIVAFKLESPNAIRKLDGFYKGFGEMVQKMEFGKHYFISKKLGEKPEKGKIKAE